MLPITQPVSRAATLYDWHLEKTLPYGNRAMVSHIELFPYETWIKPALTKEQIRQSVGYQQCLTLLNDHHVLNYLRASPHKAWVGTTLEDGRLNLTVI